MEQAEMGESKLETVHVDGLDLAYVDKGKGVPVIFVHGGMTDLRSWLGTQVEPFSKTYRAIAYSRRSHYPNPWVEYAPDYSIRTEVKDLVGLINALKLKTPVRIVGSSLGGSIVAFTALDHPELVRAMVLCEPGLFGLLEGYPEYSAYAARWKSKLSDPVAERLRTGDTEGAVTIFFNFVIGKNLTYDQIPVEYRIRLSQNARTILEEGGRVDPFNTDDAKRIKTPTLLVGGEKSPSYFGLVIEMLEKYLPNCERVTVKNASHGMHNESAPASQAFNEAVMTFLAKN
jgi:pimeloyl-ACP methyl ester carboxylesterase